MTIEQKLDEVTASVNPGPFPTHESVKRQIADFAIECLRLVDVEDMAMNCNEYGCDGYMNCIDSSNKSWRIVRERLIASLGGDK